MRKAARAKTDRILVGKVSVYLHHTAWWVYYREAGKPVRKRVGPSKIDAEQVAAQINAQLTTNSPTLLAFTPITVAELRQQFLDYHEHVLKSSVGTLRRYRAATQHLADYATANPRQQVAHDLKPGQFATYLRDIEVAPNGHRNTPKRKLRDKGVQYILETCRSVYTFARKRRHLPPYADNPFSEIPLDRLKVEDAKPVFVFDASTELAFLKRCSVWAFPIFFTLAKTGLRIGESTHLLVEDLDLDGGWLHVRNKTELGWRVKTGQERTIPLVAEVVSVLRQVIGGRASGPVFLRERFVRGAVPDLVGDRVCLAKECERRQAAHQGKLTRPVASRIAKSVWLDAGAVKPDQIRTVFVRVCRGIDHPESTCPKSWRHTFATLLQDANVDPLIRQQVMGHRPTTGSGLGMTAKYTHTRPETLRQQVEAALRQWPEPLAHAVGWVMGRS